MFGSNVKDLTVFPKTINRTQKRDTGMALVLIFLLAAKFTGNSLYVSLAVAALIMNMVYPDAYHYPAKLWFGFSNFLGKYMSGVLLSVLFFLLVTPVGFIRRLMGKDALQIKKWKKGTGSVFIKRSHLFRSEDIKNPF